MIVIWLKTKVSGVKGFILEKMIGDSFGDHSFTNFANDRGNCDRLEESDVRFRFTRFKNRNNQRRGPSQRNVAHGPDIVVNIEEALQRVIIESLKECSTDFVFARS